MNLLRWEPQVTKAVKIYGKTGHGFDKNDLKQNCYVVLFKAQDKLRKIRKERGEDAANGYVFMVCKNEILRAQAPTRDIHFVPYFEQGATQPLPANILEDLTATDQEIMYGLYYWGYSARELAERTGTSRRWVQDRKEKILELLRKEICQ